MDINNDDSSYSVSDDFEDEKSITRYSKDPELVSRLQLELEEDDSSVSVVRMHGKKGGEMVTLGKTANKGSNTDTNKKQTSRRFIKEKDKLAEIWWPMKTATFSPKDREVSACNHSIKKLTSRVTEIMRELEETKKENKLLKRLQVRQEKELTNFQTTEGELPQMMGRHREEATYLKNRLGEMKEINQTLRKNLNAAHRTVRVLSERNKMLEEVAKRKHLLEREDLALELQASKAQLKHRDAKIKDLLRDCHLIEKSHAIEYSALLRKNKALTQDAVQLEEQSQRLHTKLREREKDLAVMNIYAQRFGRNFPRRHTLVLASHWTQTELSSSSRDQVPPSLANMSTQTATTLHLSATTLTDITLDHNSTEFDLRIHGIEVDKSPLPQQYSMPQAVEETPTISQPQYRTPSPVLSPVPEESRATPTTTTNQTPDQRPRKNSLLVAEQLKDKQEKRKTALLNMLKTMGSANQPAQPGPSSTPARTTSSDVQSTMIPPDAAPPVGGSSRKPPDAAPPVGTSSFKFGISPLMQTFTNSSALIQPTTQSTTFTSIQPSTIAANLVEDKKKSELLAKLISIDNENAEREQVAVNGELRQSRKSSKDSLYFWSAPVENMHNGRPAYAKRGDPFESRVTTSGTRRATLAKAPQSQALSPEQFSRSHRDAGAQKSSFKNISDSIKEESLKPITHQTFGSSELQSSGTVLGLGKTSINDKSREDYFWENKVDVRANGTGGGIFADIMNQATVFGTGQVGQAGSKMFGVSENDDEGSMVQNSQKNFEMPTTIPEPDDLEELII